MMLSVPSNVSTHRTSLIKLQNVALLVIFRTVELFYDSYIVEVLRIRQYENAIVYVVLLKT